MQSNVVLRSYAAFFCLHMYFKSLLHVTNKEVWILLINNICTEQKWSGCRSGSCWHWTFIVQYNKVHHIVVHIVQSWLHRNPPTIWIKIILIKMQIKYLHGTKFLDPDLDRFALCKQGISQGYYIRKKVSDLVVDYIQQGLKNLKIFTCPLDKFI